MSEHETDVSLLLEKCGGRVAYFDAGQIVFQAGAPADALFVVTEGALITRMQKPSVPDGVELIDTIARPGDMIGLEAWDRAPASYASRAEAIKPSSAVCLDRPAVRTVLQEDPFLIYGMAARQAEQQEKKVRLTIEQTAETRVLVAVADIYGPNAAMDLVVSGSRDGIVITPNKSDFWSMRSIGGRAGVRHETVSRTIGSVQLRAQRNRWAEARDRRELAFRTMLTRYR